MFKNEEDAKKANQNQNMEEDYAKLYNENKIFDLNGEGVQSVLDKKVKIPLKDIINNDYEMTSRSVKRQTTSRLELNKIANSTIIVTKEMESADFFARMIAMIIALEEDSNYDNDPNFTMKMKSYLPWEDNFYTHKSVYKEYTEKNIPDWLKTGEASI
jgi:hypothetical protein